MNAPYIIILPWKWVFKSLRHTDRSYRAVVISLATNTSIKGVDWNQRIGAITERGVCSIALQSSSNSSRLRRSTSTADGQRVVADEHDQRMELGIQFEKRTKDRIIIICQLKRPYRYRCSVWLRAPKYNHTLSEAHNWSSTLSFKWDRERHWNEGEEHLWNFFRDNSLLTFSRNNTVSGNLLQLSVSQP